MPDVSISFDIGGTETDMAEEVFHLYIYNSLGTKNDGFKLFRAPKEIEYSGFANTYNEAARPDRKPLLRRSGEGLRKINMTFLLAYPDIEKSINDRLEKLETLASRKAPMIVEYGGDKRVVGDWSFTNLSYRSMERSKDNDEITRAEVTIELTEVPNPTNVGLDRFQPRNRPKFYKTKKGDTLLRIVKKFYATDNVRIVKAVAKANKIENIKHPMKAGRRIRLP